MGIYAYTKRVELGLAGGDHPVCRELKVARMPVLADETSYI